MKELILIFLFGNLLNIVNCDNLNNVESIYKPYNYDEIMNLFNKYSKSCSQYIKIDSSQNRYGINNLGGCNNPEKGCENLIVLMTDFDSYTLDRPVYYVSGLIHGDEVLGPTSVTEFVKYFCDNYNTQKNSLYYNILKNFLLVLTPMTNAYGYYYKMREEKVYDRIRQSWEFLDPNRDFMYWNTKEKTISKCMNTLTGRTINEIFNEFIVVGALTFHGGDNVLGYPWGNYIHIDSKYKHRSSEAPDFQAFHQIGSIMQELSGSENNRKENIKNYKLGDMTSTVYALNGALEDWAYGGWENNANKKLGINSFPIKNCKSYTFSEYNQLWSSLNEENSDYKTRCMIYLVEADDFKQPKIKYYGIKETNKNLFDFEKATNFFGHIPRNMRLIYIGTDLSHASIYIDKDNIKFQNNKITIPFHFMGCINLEKYVIYKIKLNALTRDNMNIKNLRNLFSNENIAYTKYNNTCYYKNYTFFNKEIDLSSKSDDLNEIYIIQGVGPDENWKNQKSPDPKVTPQSHVVRSKINKEYLVENGNYSLGTNYYFYSYPILLDKHKTLEIIDDIDSYFIEDEINLIKIKENNIFDDIKAFGNLYISKDIKQEQIRLSSDIIYNIDFEFKFYSKSDENIKMFLLKDNINIYLLLSSDKETYSFYEIKSKISLESNKIKIRLALSGITFNGLNIRQRLLNSIIALEIKNRRRNLYTGLYQITNKNLAKGKYYLISNEENFRGKLYATTNLLNINEKEKNFEYTINILKISTRQLILKIDYKFKNKYNVFIILFPFLENFILDLSNNTSEIKINLNGEANGKIIGKLIYLIPIELKLKNSFEDWIKIKKATEFYEDIKKFMDLLNRFLKSNFTYYETTINSYNSIRNEESIININKFLKKLNITSNLNSSHSYSEKRNKVLFASIIILCLTLIAVIIFIIIFKNKNKKNDFYEFRGVDLAESKPNI